MCKWRNLKRGADGVREKSELMDLVGGTRVKTFMTITMNFAQVQSLWNIIVSVARGSHNLMAKCFVSFRR